MLLSRTAEEIYWLGRHLERAEALARVVREHTDLLVDLPVDVESDWSALFAITGVEEPAARTPGTDEEARVVRYLLADPANAGSLRRTVERARENLRVSRPSFPVAVWSALNQLRLDLWPMLQHADRRAVRIELCEHVVEVCQRIDGVISGSMSHGPARRFLLLGRLIERADVAGRVLDVRATLLLGDGNPSVPPADRSPYEDVRWLGVLRSLGAQEMYRRASTVAVDGPRVTEFVIADRSFPRSIGFCVDQIGVLAGYLPASEEVAAVHQRLDALVRNRPVGGIDPVDLHAFVDDLQTGLAELHGVASSTWFRRRHAVVAPFRVA